MRYKVNVYEIHTQIHESERSEYLEHRKTIDSTPKDTINVVSIVSRAKNPIPNHVTRDEIEIREYLCEKSSKSTQTKCNY